MVEQGFLRLERTTGIFLTLGFATMMVGALMFVSRGGLEGAAVPRFPRFAWERSFIMAAVVLTAIGLVLLERILHDTNGLLLARLGASAYFFGAVILVTAEALGLAEGQLSYPPIVIYVVLAFLGQAAVGGALLQSRLLPTWIGWLTIAWNLAWLLILPITTPGDVYFPVLHHLMPMLIGIALLLDVSNAVAT